MINWSSLKSYRRENRRKMVELSIAKENPDEHSKEISSRGAHSRQDIASCCNGECEALLGCWSIFGVPQMPRAETERQTAASPSVMASSPWPVPFYPWCFDNTGHVYVGCSVGERLHQSGPLYRLASFEHPRRV
ncbi:hypothetical protein RRG08_014201 [Elysia crispata]|uniref:Uncharacterized protein n=1 Tax=Elysia crispata TaxID=231223 RepID=A0AAE0Z2U4_9GAST|nr:hypothetical protein RRG08_014201 [Elysia crispata]